MVSKRSIRGLMVMDTVGFVGFFEVGGSGGEGLVLVFVSVFTFVFVFVRKGLFDVVSRRSGSGVPMNIKSEGMMDIPGVVDI